MIDFNILKSKVFTNHTQEIIAKKNTEKLKYFLESKPALIYLDSFTELGSNEYLRIKDNILLISTSHSSEDKLFINEFFKGLDAIIDLDFVETSSNNHSDIDIYSVSYSSTFSKNVIGQAMAKSNSTKKWWNILWKDTDKDSEISALNKYTLVHEIGHALGLSHPNEDPFNIEWNTDDTMMSYNHSPSGLRSSFTEADINALISIWGREDDDGSTSYQKNFDEYKFYRINSNSYSIKTDIGLESLSNIDLLKFKDKEVNVSQDIKGTFDQLTGVYDPAAEMFRIYNAAFSRFPDSNGLRYWTNQYESGIDDHKVVTKSFINSDEFITKYGGILSHGEYVERIYTNVLGREYDLSGYNYWVGNLENNIEERWSVLWNIAQSLENINLFKETTGLSI